MTEEIFGPIVPIMRVSTHEEAVRLANDSPLGLNAYVFTTDAERGRRLAERIEAGSVLVNEVLSNGGTPEAPFGGIKHSGLGRAMGPEGLRAMCHVKHLSVDRLPTPERHPMGFPYSGAQYAWFERGLRALYSGSVGRGTKLARKLLGLP
jgi:succinate-semialdehyde dehydrogenase/glutarate-semialdehyde dehydrogenase